MAPRFIEILNEELHLRKERNSRYSLRAFANFLETHPSALSRILRGQQPVSVKTCKIMVTKLELGGDRLRFFVESIYEDVALRARLNFSKATGIQIGEVARNLSPLADIETYRSIAEFMPIPVWIVDSEARIIHTNESALRYLDSSFENFAQFVGDEGEPLVQRMRDVFQLRRSAEIVGRVENDDKSKLTFRMSPILNRDGDNSLSWLVTLIERSQVAEGTLLGDDKVV